MIVRNPNHLWLKQSQRDPKSRGKERNFVWLKSTKVGSFGWNRQRLVRIWSMFRKQSYMQVVETNYLNANTHSNISDIALLLGCHSTKKITIGLPIKKIVDSQVTRSHEWKRLIITHIVNRLQKRGYWKNTKGVNIIIFPYWYVYFVLCMCLQVSFVGRSSVRILYIAGRLVLGENL